MKEIVSFYKSRLRLAGRYTQKNKVGSSQDAFYEVAVCCMLSDCHPGLGPKSIRRVSFVDTPILAEDLNDSLKVPRNWDY